LTSLIGPGADSNAGFTIAQKNHFPA